jgi:hypothetical protein
MLAFSAYLATNNNLIISIISENGTALNQITEYDEALNHLFQNVDAYLCVSDHPAWYLDGT